MVIGIDIRIPLMVVISSRTTLWVHQGKPVTIQVSIEMIATQRSEALCMFNVKCIIDRRNRMERVIILCSSFATVRVECRLYQYNGIAQSFHYISILGGYKIVGCQNRCVGTCQLTTMHVISQLDYHLLIIVRSGITIVRICQFYMVLTDIL